MYKHGDGTSYNYFMAKHYLEKGVENGSPESMYNLSDLYINGLGVDKYLLKGSELYKESYNKYFQNGCSNIKELSSRGIYPTGNTKPASKPNSILMLRDL
ncbi:TPR repeat protein [Leclercia adecarboxylata]|uniref:tetratricopeptide repeat protein n=1 Tax=Leclercia adecarboxylata TaxID=83655 RepID=UPI00247C876B|nr:TPR repeat protein [Leclercia adecarboxylata]